jgi:MFS family permease
MSNTGTNTNTETVLYCENHPNVETTLRCSKCNKPICAKCAVLTPTGYKCRECVRGQQKVFETAEWFDYPVAFIIAGVLALVGSLAVNFLGFFIIFIAPIVGGLIAEVVRKAVNRRRSKKLYYAATAGAIIGGIYRFLGVFLAFLGITGGIPGFNILFSLLIPGIYVVLVASTVYYRLSGIRMGI